MNLGVVAGHLAHLIVAAIWGGMVFFSGVVAPTVFKAMDTSRAGSFLRELFPVYYLVLGIASALAAVAAIAARQFAMADIVVLVAVTAGFGAARLVLMPRVNEARDQVLAGDPTARHRFRRWHSASVAINGLQLIALTVVLVRIY